MVPAYLHLSDVDARLAAMLGAPALMGIVNITPNSFSDGSIDPDASARHADELIRAGAAIVDLGAEASSFFRPGVAPVPANVQLGRLLPVLGRLGPNAALISIDTRSARVAREAVAAGAHIINDISAGEHDPAMLETAAALGVPIVLMHISPTYPENPAQSDPAILETVSAYLLRRAEAAVAAGVARERILLDPGVGFGKTPVDNLALTMKFPALDLPYPVVLGVSRKRFLTLFPPSPEIAAALSPLATHERDLATGAMLRHLATLPPRRGGVIHRVHNVALAAKALKLR